MRSYKKEKLGYSSNSDTSSLLNAAHIIITSKNTRL